MRALKIVQMKGTGPESDGNSGAEGMEWTPKYLKYSSKPTEDPKPTPSASPQPEKV